MTILFSNISTKFKLCFIRKGKLVNKQIYGVLNASLPLIIVLSEPYRVKRAHFRYFNNTRTKWKFSFHGLYFSAPWSSKEPHRWNYSTVRSTVLLDGRLCWSQISRNNAYFDKIIQQVKHVVVLSRSLFLKMP